MSSCTVARATSIRSISILQGHDVPEDSIDDGIVLAAIDTTGHGKILAPLFLGPSCEPTWHNFHTKHPVMTSYSDEVKTFTVTSWDKKEKMLQVEITKMEEVLCLMARSERKGGSNSSSHFISRKVSRVQ